MRENCKMCRQITAGGVVLNGFINISPITIKNYNCLIRCVPVVSTHHVYYDVVIYYEIALIYASYIYVNHESKPFRVLCVKYCSKYYVSHDLPSIAEGPMHLPIKIISWFISTNRVNYISKLSS